MHIWIVECTHTYVYMNMHIHAYIHAYIYIAYSVCIYTMAHTNKDVFADGLKSPEDSAGCPLSVSVGIFGLLFSFAFLFFFYFFPFLALLLPCLHLKQVNPKRPLRPTGR